MNTPIVHVTNRHVFTDTLVIAEQCGLEHASVIKLVRKYQSDFEELGRVSFEIRPFMTDGGMQNREVAELTEDHATYLITLFRNTPIVRKFKLTLVKEFRKAIDEINRLYAEPQRTTAIKDKRSSHSPMMAALEELRADQGKETRDDNYMTENKLCNFVVIGRYIGVCKIGGEDGLTNYEIEMLAQVRKRNEACILAGLEYQERKSKLVEFGKKYRVKYIDPAPRTPLLELVV